MVSPELHMPGGVGGRWGQSRLLPSARVQANLHQYLSTHVIPAQAGIQKFLFGEILVQNVIPAQAGIQKSNQGFALQSGVADRLVSIS